MASASAVSSASPPSSRGCVGRFCSPRARCGDNRLPFKPFSSRKLVPRKSSAVRGTVLRDQEEEVIVEESFRSTTVGDTDANKGVSPSSDLEAWVIKIEQSINVFLTDSVIKILDSFYHDRDYARFFVLETIARVPYFAFMSVLHMYESFGWWRRADYLKVHFAESWNEMHHLLVMEELGGNSWWFDRFLAQHIAFFYYIMTVVMYAVSPRMACKWVGAFKTVFFFRIYDIPWIGITRVIDKRVRLPYSFLFVWIRSDHFSECVESHAFSTYDKFLKAQGEELKKLPAPEVAVKYYTGDDLYLFDEFQTSRPPQSRRPKIENLYDVFLNIRDDEAEHCKTMRACQTHGNLRSPHSLNGEDAQHDADDGGCVLPEAADCEGIVDCVKKSVSASPPQ